MAPLELSRAVNDALQNADFSAALAPLEEQPNLRVSDLPKLEKKTLSALSNALQTPCHAHFWARALVSTTPSVALFTFRTLAKLGDSIHLLGEPLQKALRDFWENQPPPRDGVWEKAELDQRAAQEAMLIRGFEMLLYADTPRAIELCCEQARIYQPRELAREKLYKERNERAEAARRLVQEALSEHLPDSLKERKLALYEIRQIVDYEAYNQALTRPDVAELMSLYGTLEPEPQHNPLKAIQRAFGQQKPARKEELTLARARAGAYFRHYLDAGLKTDGEDSAVIALAFPNCLNLFDASRRIEDMAAVLSGAHPLVVTLPEEHPTRLLWIQVAYSFHWIVYGYTVTVCSDCNLQHVLDTLELLQLSPDAIDFTPEFQQNIEKARSAYRKALGNSPEQVAFREQEEESPEPIVQSSIRDTAQAVEAVNKLFAPVERAEGEGASEFLLRVSQEERIRGEEASAIIKDVVNIAREPSEIVRSYHNSSQQAQQQFRETLDSFSAEEKRQMVIECCQSGVKQVSMLGEWWRDKALLEPLIPQMWNLLDEALVQQAQGLKKPNEQVSPAYVRQITYLRIVNVWAVVSEVQGVPGQLRLIQQIARSRAKDLAQQWEQLLIVSLSMLPRSGTQEDWMAWKLDESVDEALEYLVLRVANEPQFYRDRAYSQLAIAFYRRYTEPTRIRCYEVAELSDNLMDEVFEVVRVHNDEWAWANLLSGASRKDERFYEFWNAWRANTESRERIAVTVLDALGEATSDGGVAMMLQMLGDVELSELAPHWVSIAQSLESPHPKVAKWALETLHKIPDVGLDWPHVIDVVGEKLWSDNAALAKAAARFLGGVPSPHATVAWEKLEEALALDNMVLVDACLRSLIELKKKNRSAALGTDATERLELLAQLAPERFAKPFARLQAP